MRVKKKAPLDILEKAIGHSFANRSLLECALTHISALGAVDRLASYQRLEFLGDRVLGLAVSDMLYAAFPDDEEGALSRRLAALVRKETCAAVSVCWDVGPYIKLGPGEASSGGRKRLTTLGDVCEALIGAVFLDAGYEAARRVVVKGWEARLHSAGQPPSDAKTALQEWAQARAFRAPTYRLVSRTGPDHKPRFVVAVDIETQNPAEGHGTSKRLAEQAAAAAFLEREGIVRKNIDRG